MAENLLSLRKFVESGFTVLLNRKELRIIDPITENVVIKGSYESPSWIIEFPLINPQNLHNEKIYVANLINESNNQNLLESGGAEAQLKEIGKDETFEIIKLSDSSTTDTQIYEIQIINLKSIQDSLEFEKPKIIVL